MASFGSPAALCILGLFVIAGCSPASSGEHPLASSTSSAVAATSNPSEPVPFATAWPGVRTRSFNPKTFIEIAATPDGSLALGDAIDGSTGIRLGPATLDRSTGKIAVLRRFSNPAFQVVSIGADDNWIVWAEGSLEPNFADWTIYSYGRRSHQIRTLATAPPSHPNTPLVTICISRGVVVWSAVEAPDQVFHVYAINADATGRRVVASDAQGPQIAWPWVAYSIKPTSAGSASVLVRRNLSTNDVQHIAGPTNASYFAYDGTSLAWISSDMRDIYLDAPLDSAPRLLYSGRYLQFVSLSARLVGWGEDKGALVYDRKLRTVVQLSNLYDFYPVLSGGALDWLYQPDPHPTDPFVGTVMNQVNVADLP